MSDAPTTRHCGSCDVCCHVCPVTALEKDAFTRCQYQRVGAPGCRIYARRPPECQAYRCSWLMGLFGDDDRPDQSGVLFEHSHLGDDDDPQSGLLVLIGMVHDNSKRGQWGHFAQYACKGTLVAIAGDANEDHRVYGYPPDVEAWLDFLSRTRAAGYDRTSQPGEAISIKTREH